MEKNRIGEILVSHGYCSGQDISKALSIQRDSQKKLGHILLEMRVVSEKEIIEGLIDQFELNDYLERELQKREAQIRQLAMLDREMSLARGVQQSFLPRTFPDIPGMGVYGACCMSRAVGGDYFDIFSPRGKSQKLIVLADVAGHGLSAAIIMASFRSMLRTALSEGVTQLRYMARKLNSLLYEDLHQNGLFITCLLLKYDFFNARLNVLNCGHPSPLCTSLRHEELLDLGNPPLGIYPEPDPELKVVDFEFKTGEALLLFSDGILDGRDCFGSEYGLSRLKGCFWEARERTPQEIVEHIMSDFRGKVIDQRDDVTLMALQKL